jgi:cation:H+ antiporter
MLAAVATLLGGLLLLYKGADWLVGGSSSLARRLGIKPIVIGLTVVAFGTSAPELFVNLTASFAGKADIAVSNIIGSNIANILLILGVVAAIRPLRLRTDTVARQIPLALLASALVWVLVNDRLIVGRAIDRLDRIDGIILLAFFAAFLYYVVTIAAREPDKDGIEKKAVGISLGLLALGLLGLSLGGKLTVDGAAGIARLFGLSERFIGLTVIAIGTSLPELLTSVVAVIRRHDDIAVGNIVGSNIFNIFWILGLSAVMRPLPVSRSSLFDILVVIGATVLLLIFSLMNGKRGLTHWFKVFFARQASPEEGFAVRRWQGAVLISLYAAYLVMLLASM